MSAAPVAFPNSWEVRLRDDGAPEWVPSQAVPRSLDAGEVRLRFLAGGICGSDIGTIAGVDTTDAPSRAAIAPLHEVVAEVVESRDNRLEAHQVVVGTGLTGLASELIEEGLRFIPVPAGFSVSEAVSIQPVATVIRAVAAMPPVVGRDVVVVGAGAIGLAFVHVLRTTGARSVTAVDPVHGRAELARHYGATDFIASTGQLWCGEGGHHRPDVIIDAVGRQPEIIHHAITAVADGGYVLGFGSAADGDYAIPFSEMYHRNLTLASGRTRTDWPAVLERGGAYLSANRTDFEGYISHRFFATEASLAYELCSSPDPSRVKVVVEAK